MLLKTANAHRCSGQSQTQQGGGQPGKGVAGIGCVRGIRCLGGIGGRGIRSLIKSLNRGLHICHGICLRHIFMICFRNMGKLGVDLGQGIFQGSHIILTDSSQFAIGEEAVNQ